MAETLRVAVVANKTWECAPVVERLLARDARPAALEGATFRRGYDPAEEPVELDPDTKERPKLPPEAEGLDMRASLPIRPRLSIESVRLQLSVEIWCVEDWMRSKRRLASPEGSLGKLSTSSSHEKFTYALPRIRERCFRGRGPELLIAMGTAGVVYGTTLNGCVTIGSRVYVHDAWHDAPADEIADQVERFGPMLREQISGQLDRPIEAPRLKRTLFSEDLSAEARHSAEARFLAAPIHPARPPRILAGHGFASLGTINICDYEDYVWADEETLRLFERQVRQREIGSMETTHGLIGLSWPQTPFLFVSGLTDRVPMFNSEVTPRKYAQNFVAAHNAGVTLAHLLPEFARLAREGLFSPIK